MTIYDYFRQWCQDGTWEPTKAALREKLPMIMGGEANAAQLSSIVKPSERPQKGAWGYDAGKKIKGRKRHVLVDTLGLVLKVLVFEADLQNRVVAPRLFKRLQLIWADGGYSGQLVQWMRGWTLEIVERSDFLTGFQVFTPPVGGSIAGDG